MLVPQVYERYGYATTSSPAFRAWFAANADWLRPYAAFCLLRDVFQVHTQGRAGQGKGRAACGTRMAAHSAWPLHRCSIAPP